MRSRSKKLLGLFFWYILRGFSRVLLSQYTGRPWELLLNRQKSSRSSVSCVVARNTPEKHRGVMQCLAGIHNDNDVSLELGLMGSLGLSLASRSPYWLKTYAIWMLWSIFFAEVLLSCSEMCSFWKIVTKWQEPWCKCLEQNLAAGMWLHEYHGEKKLCRVLLLLHFEKHRTMITPFFYLTPILAQQPHDFLRSKPPCFFPSHVFL